MQRKFAILELTCLISPCAVNTTASNPSSVLLTYHDAMMMSHMYDVIVATPTFSWSHTSSNLVKICESLNLLYRNTAQRDWIASN